MAGYSGTPLAKKLGIKPGASVLLLDAPIGFGIAPLPEGVVVRTDLRSRRPANVALLFAASRDVLTSRFGPVAARLTPSGGLWVAWPKKASGVPTDLSDAAVRAFGLDRGLVDNKVCAIDETWSSLRFVRRLRDRP